MGRPEDSTRPIASAVSRSAASCGILRRSEEHTSELQSPCNLVCRLLLEKKKSELQSPCNLVCRLLLEKKNDRTAKRDTVHQIRLTLDVLQRTPAHTTLDASMSPRIEHH